MISFSHVYKTYRASEGRENHALRDVNLEVEKGEFVFMTGPSGAGKTTLFRLLSAFDRPSSGRTLVGGYDIATITTKELPFFRRRIGVVFQDFRLLRDRTTFDNVALPLEILGERRAMIERRVLECLDSVGLADKRDELPDQMSGGEQQRVAIARALVHRPGLLIADEPTGNLDPAMSRDVMRLFDRANAQGTTIFIATHDHDMVRRANKRVVEINRGQISDQLSGQRRESAILSTEGAWPSTTT